MARVQSAFEKIITSFITQIFPFFQHTKHYGFAILINKLKHIIFIQTMTGYLSTYNIQYSKTNFMILLLTLVV